jgi:hypothetical protein
MAAGDIGASNAVLGLPPAALCTPFPPDLLRSKVPNVRSDGAVCREGAVAGGLQKAIETRLAAHRDSLARLSPRQAPLDVMTQLGGCRTEVCAPLIHDSSPERRRALCEANGRQREESEKTGRPAVERLAALTGI